MPCSAEDPDSQASSPASVNIIGPEAAEGSGWTPRLDFESSDEGCTVGSDTTWLWQGRSTGPASGEIWEDFELGALLGRGGMGIIYRAVQRSLARRCAIKVLPERIAENEILRRRFILEARAHSQLSSPQVVQVIGAGTHRGNLYFAMEYVEGRNLHQVIEERRAEGRWFEPEEAIDIAIQVARGLQEADAHGLVHRDIKPGNLIMDERGRIKIADFGLVKARGMLPLTMEGYTVGTPHYVSPEQACGKDVDSRSDLYSLGVVLYLLLTGRRPYDAPSPDEVAYLHRWAPVPSPRSVDPGIDRRLSAVVERLLAKDPDERYPSAAELIVDLNRCMQGSTGEDGASGFQIEPVTQTLRLVWRSGRRVILLAVAAALAVVLVSGWSLYHHLSASHTAVTPTVPAAVVDRVPVDAGRSPLAPAPPAAAERPEPQADSVVDRLREQLAVLDTDAAFDQRTERELAAALEQWRDLRGEDAAFVAWSAALGTHLEAVASVTQDIDRALAALPDEPGLEVIERRLDDLLRRTGRSDPRWSQRADDASARRQELLADAQPLLGFDPQERATVADLQQLGERLADLAPSGVLSGRLLLELEARLDAAVGRRVRLAETLAVLDQVGPVDPGLESTLERYAALLPVTDPRVERWRQSLREREALVARLAALDQAVPVPPTASEDLERLAELEGATGRIRRWQTVLTRLGALNSHLEPLDRAAGIPAEAERHLAELEALVGPEDRAVQRWRRMLERVAVLRAASTAALHPPVDAVLARTTLGELRSVVGDADPGLQEQARVLALRLGPPAPDWAADAGQDEYGRWLRLELDGASLALRYLPPGRFVMGSPATEEGRDPDETQYEVELSRPLWMGEIEVSQQLYRAVVGRSPSRFEGEDLPVERVNRNDCLHFIDRLQAEVPGLVARLPTEAEWEYACRAGADGPWASGADPADGGGVWDRRSADGRSRPVATSRPNRWGLFDLHGNVWEWCADRYAPYPTTRVSDPLQLVGEQGVARGGSWSDDRDKLRCANRLALDPGLRSAQLGFRIVVEVDLDDLPGLDQLAPLPPASPQGGG